MAVGKCPDCDYSPYADTADHCPRCGGKQRPIKVITWTEPRTRTVNCCRCRGKGKSWEVHYRFRMKICSYEGWSKWDKRTDTGVTHLDTSIEIDERYNMKTKESQWRLLSKKLIQCDSCKGSGKSEEHFSETFTKIEHL